MNDDNEKDPNERSRPRLRGVAPELARRAVAMLDAARAEGVELVVTEGLRSRERQALLYAQGRTTPGPIVTHAPPGTSRHESGRAVDVAPLDAHGRPHWPEDRALWERIGAFGEAQGLEWGGRWQRPDRPHFELPKGVA